MNKTKQEIIEIGKMLWEKDLVSARSGNISLKGDDGQIYITTHDSCLGKLTEDDIVAMNSEGKSLEKKEPTSEKPTHVAVHKKFKQPAVIHVHPPFCNGFFAVQNSVDFVTFESKLLLGAVPCVPQSTPAISDPAAVAAALENSNIVALKNHGVIAIGETLFDAFCLIQLLEDAIKVQAVAKLFGAAGSATSKQQGHADMPIFEMFSDEHIKAIVDLVNTSPDFLNQAKSLALRTKLAVKMDENGKVFCFTFHDGAITEVTHAEKDAEFVISGPGDVWRKIFNRELDPFVATTQKKLKLQGDFGKISRWYAPFNKLFEVWRKVGVK